MQTDKVIKAVGLDTVLEMDAMREDELKQVIVEASEAMREVKQQLDDNQEYQELKNKVSDMGAGKREVDKRQKAKVAYSLRRLTELGKMDTSDRYAWEKLRVQQLKEIAARQKRKAEDEAAQAPGVVRHIKGNTLEIAIDLPKGTTLKNLADGTGPS